MKSKSLGRIILSSVLSSFILLATMSHAATTLMSTSKYSITEGVAFTLGNDGASNFLFNWTDPSGALPPSFTNIVDPTLVLTLGQTYTFQRSSGAHPFAIMDNSAGLFITGLDGTYSRNSGVTTTQIDNATLKPIADFTANPAPTSDLITWTPSETGEFWYTCTVTSHPGMTGKITVIPEPSILSLFAGAFAFGVFQRRRSSDRK